VAWKKTVLVVANQTATSDDLLDHLRGRSEGAPSAFHLIVPTRPWTSGAPSGREEAQRALEGALQRMREAGLEVEGEVGDSDPVTAVHEVWDPRRFDEIIVSTLPTGSSRWLESGVPRRLQRLCDVSVEHVVARPRREYVATAPPRERERRGVLEPLASLGWQGRGRGDARR
jgi:hypothetical protein